MHSPKNSLKNRDAVSLFGTIDYVQPISKQSLEKPKSNRHSTQAESIHNLQNTFVEKKLASIVIQPIICTAAVPAVAATERNARLCSPKSVISLQHQKYLCDKPTSSYDCHQIEASSSEFPDISKHFRAASPTASPRTGRQLSRATMTAFGRQPSSHMGVGVTRPSSSLGYDEELDRSCPHRSTPASSFVAANLHSVQSPSEPTGSPDVQGRSSPTIIPAFGRFTAAVEDAAGPRHHTPGAQHGLSESPEEQLLRLAPNGPELLGTSSPSNGAGSGADGAGWARRRLAASYRSPSRGLRRDGQRDPKSRGLHRPRQAPEADGPGDAGARGDLGSARQDASAGRAKTDSDDESDGTSEGSVG